jgi:class 3 adenylate cyclase
MEGHLDWRAAATRWRKCERVVHGIFEAAGGASPGLVAWELSVDETSIRHDRLVQAFARRRRHGGEVAVMMVDIDDFKTLSDTHGHAAGDAVLRAVARRLTDSVRVEDTIARIGGDEFAVLTELVAGEGRR